MLNLTQRTRNTAKNSLVGILAQMVMMIGSFVCRMIFVRCLREEYLGVSGLFSNVISKLSLVELGIGSAITYELYHALAYQDDKETAALMTFYRKAYIIIGSVIGFCGIILMPFLQYFVKVDSGIQENIYILYLLYLFNTVISYFFSYRSTIIDAAQCGYVTTIIYTLTVILQDIIQCAVLLLYKNFLLYLIIQVLFTVIYNVAVSMIAGKMFPVIKKRGEKLDPQQQKRMFKNVRALLITTISGKLVNGTDNIIITAISGLAMTGLNSNYALISQTLTGFTTKIQQGITAGIGNVMAIEGEEQKRKIFYTIYFGFFWMYFWCTCCYILLIQNVIEIFFGAKYLLPFSIALITGLNLYALEMDSVVGIFKRGMGLFQYGKYTSFCAGLMNIVLSIVLGTRWGVTGILVASFISRMTTMKWYIPYVTFKFGFHISAWNFFRRDIRYWAEGIVIFGVTCFLCDLVESNVWIELIYRAVVCLVVPNLLIILSHRNEYECKELMRKIVSIML